MKKFSAIVIFLCLFLTVLGYHLLFRIQLREIRLAMRKELSQAGQRKLRVLTFTSEQAALLEWENEKEFQYHEQMYDVQEKHWEGKQLVVRCLEDQKERTLREAYQKINRQHPDSPLQLSLLKLMHTPFLMQVMSGILQPYPEGVPIFIQHTAILPPGGGSRLERPPMAG
ncbi:MAG: hypothetical protein ACXVBR_07450 [Flavisolibacter sp.]